MRLVLFGLIVIGLQCCSLVFCAEAIKNSFDKMYRNILLLFCGSAWVLELLIVRLVIKELQL